MKEGSAEFWKLRNQILDDMTRAWKGDFNFQFYERMSLLAAKGSMVMEYDKLRTSLNETLKEIEHSTRKLQDEIDRCMGLKAVFGQIEPINWDLIGLEESE